MVAEILIFPMHRRVGYIRQKARKVLNRRDRADVDRYLDTEVLACQRGSLSRFNLPPEVIERELRSLRGAIDAYAWRLTYQSGAERA